MPPADVGEHPADVPAGNLMLFRELSGAQPLQEERHSQLAILIAQRTTTREQRDDHRIVQPTCDALDASGQRARPDRQKLGDLPPAGISPQEQLGNEPLLPRQELSTLENIQRRLVCRRIRTLRTLKNGFW